MGSISQLILRRGWYPQAGRWMHHALGTGGGTAPHGHGGLCPPPRFLRPPRALQLPEQLGAVQHRCSPGTAAPGRAQRALPTPGTLPPLCPRVGVLRELRSRSASQALPCAVQTHRPPLRSRRAAPGVPFGRGGKEAKPGGNLGQRPLPLPTPPLAWLGSVARKTWQAMGESGLSGCALIR